MWWWIHCTPREVAPMINQSIWLVKISTSFLVWICLASTFRNNYLFNAKLKCPVLWHILTFYICLQIRNKSVVFSWKATRMGNKLYYWNFCQDNKLLLLSVCTWCLVTYGINFFYGCMLTKLEMEHLFKNSLSFCACDWLSVRMKI